MQDQDNVIPKAESKTICSWSWFIMDLGACGLGLDCDVSFLIWTHSNELVSTTILVFEESCWLIKLCRTDCILSLTLRLLSTAFSVL